MTTKQPATTPGRALLHGVRDTLPLVVGAAPFGIVYGLLACRAGLEAAPAQAMSAIVFAGSSQFVAAQLFAESTPGPIIVLTALVVNLRHLLYGASLGPAMRRLSATWRALLAFLLTDEMYAVSIAYNARHPNDPQFRWYFLGSGLTLFSVWQTCTALGIFAGGALPNLVGLGLDFALPVTFIGLAVPSITDRPALAAALAASATALLAHDLPHKSWIMLAAVVGVGVGLVVERVAEPRPAVELEAQ
jgi:4-azaleucine resistance transporter AzlC